MEKLLRRTREEGKTPGERFCTKEQREEEELRWVLVDLT
jgi:hypothetical protein